MKELTSKLNFSHSSWRSTNCTHTCENKVCIPCQNAIFNLKQNRFPILFSYDDTFQTTVEVQKVQAVVKRRLFLSPEQEDKRVKHTNLKYSSPNTLKKKIDHQKEKISALKSQNLKYNRILESIQNEAHAEVNVTEDGFRELVLSMFHSGMNKSSVVKEKMQKIMLECLHETVKSDAVPKDEMINKINDTVEYLFENMTNLFHDLSNNKRLIRYSPTAMNMFIAMYTSSSG